MKLPDEHADLAGMIPLTPQALEGRAYDEERRDFSAFGGLTAVPLAAAEFVKASMFYPIIFWGEALTAVAVVGVQGSGNLFVDPRTGAYDRAAYVPAYLRRSPFALGGDGDVLFDPASKAIGLTGRPLFEPAGPSRTHAELHAFLMGYERERANTVKMATLLRGMGLIERRAVAIQGQGGAGELSLGEHYAVNEARLNQLGAEDLGELHRMGALAPMFAHVASGHQWWPLMVRAATRALKEAQSLT